MNNRIKQLEDLKILLISYFDGYHICGSVSDRIQNEIDIKLQEIVYGTRFPDDYRLTIVSKVSRLDFDGSKEKLKNILNSLADVTNITSFEIENLKDYTDPQFKTCKIEPNMDYTEVIGLAWDLIDNF